MKALIGIITNGNEPLATVGFIKTKDKHDSFPAVWAIGTDVLDETKKAVCEQNKSLNESDLELVVREIEVEL